MIVLALDTSSAASVALADAHTVHAVWQQPQARRHAELIGPALSQVLAAGPRPELVAVGIGPAPFTGMRAGIAAGLGAAVGLGLECVGVRSHDALALAVAEAGVSGAMLIAGDARRREVYWSEYSGLDDAGLPVLTAGPAVAKPAALAQRWAGRQGARAGRGFELYPDDLGPASRDPRGGQLPDEPLAAHVAMLAARTAAAGRAHCEPVPLYLREPDATPLPGR